VVENLEMGIVKPDNTIVWLSVTAAPLPVEGHGIVITYGDITARKKMEEALRESEERYRTVVSNTPVVTFVTDEKGIFTLSEGKGLAKLGLQPGQVVGLSVFDVYHDYPTIMETMKNALAGYSQREEVEVNGIIFDVFYTPVLDQHGKVVKVIGVSNDITERKQAEDQIVKLNQELEQRVRERTLQLETTNKELEAFSYSVSHDLRAPLRGIDGWSQALLEDYHDQLDEQGREYIDRVRSETQRMGHLIDDMLRLSRLTRVEMVKNNVDLSTLAQTIADRLKHDEPQRQVDFTIQAGLIAQGDPHLLEAVLGNLLGNAFKFTGKRADARIEFGETEIQNQRVFFVRDNGAGFDMAYAKKLFGAFQRMHKLSEFPGTGVGLAIVQRIVNRHGGRVWAEAEIDRGAAFYFTLG
jgi:PAS domain S-box-containing protein